MKEPPRITHVYHWPNGMTMVFDQYGQQMPDYQGPTSEAKALIERDRPPGAKITSGVPWPRKESEPGDLKP